MAADPDEGLDEAGYITTGVDLAKVRAPFDAVLAEVSTRIRATLQQDLHGLYLYGSVATGQAVPPGSDVDLLAVVTTEHAVEMCHHLTEDLTNLYRPTVRDVAIGAGSLESFLAPTPAAEANRCFLKHYCVSIAGVDLRTDLPRCRPDKALAREFVGDLEGMIAGFRQQLQDATSPSDVQAVAALVGRRLLMAAAVLYSITDRTWTTARTSGAGMLTRHHPEYAEHAGRALAWIGEPSRPGRAAPTIPDPSRKDVETVLDELGALVMRDVRNHLSGERG
ncbi:nucleotidyltransferase domain-containing protein [Actinopolymorpha sp. B9G3]|uniref:nucleotidyltransferase domain-containing protein n=1 Tax=Actinopolymorpha sp. B9G3 TaxID=3158970 RepID=UPI0032D8DE2F